MTGMFYLEAMRLIGLNWDSEWSAFEKTYKQR
jgi:hypothetical protein